MWTDENRARYNRDHLRYPSDMTNDEWAHVEPLFPPAKPGGGKRSVDMRAVVNGVMDVSSTGCQWRYLPKEFPSRSTVNRYFCLWNWDGTLDRLHHALYVKCREKAEREARPPACIIDGKTREERGNPSASSGGGAHRSAWVRRGQPFGELRRSRARSGIFSSICKGCCRTPSFIAPAFRIATGESLCWRRCPVSFLCLGKLFADSAYQGPIFANALAKILPRIETEIVKRSDQTKGFVKLPKRWIVDGSTSSP